MSKIFLSVLVGLLAVTFTLDAEAQRRLGGGRTVGRQAPQVQKTQTAPQAAPTTPAQQAATSPAQSAAQPAAAARPAAATNAAGAATAARSPMKNLLIGAAAGLGLMALASWLGFGEGMATVMLFLLVGAVVVMLVGYVLRRRSGLQPALQGVGGVRSPMPHVSQRAERIEPVPLPLPVENAMGATTSGMRPGSAMDHFMRDGAVNPLIPWGVPDDFDTKGFLAQARAYFSKLQSAWHSGDLDALSDFATNDMFIALTHELHARVAAPQSTEVVTLEARLLGIETSATEHLASVRFTGTLRIDGEEEKVDEAWNLAKPVDGKTGWLLAGIQQIEG